MTSQEHKNKPAAVDPELWYINGAAYDLKPFIKSHPGGRDILIMSKGMPDATPLFESYHAMSNLNGIRRMLEKYRVERALVDDASVSTHGDSDNEFEDLYVPEREYSFHKGDFYDVLRTRVRAEFGAFDENTSVSKRVKSTSSKYFWFKSISQSIVFFVAFALAFVSPFESAGARFVCAFLAGHMFIQLGFCLMHDASHFAVSHSSKQHINEWVSRVWNALALWRHDLWTYHHSVWHHATTGSETDPDIRFSNPYIRKSPLTKKRWAKVENFIETYLGAYGWAAWCFVILVMPPFGMWFGQVVAYRLLWHFRGRLWHMDSVPEESSSQRTWIETALSTTMVALLVFRLDVLSVFAYILALNVTYCVCILPDHDTYETVQNFHKNASTDWGVIQAVSSGNFATSNPIMSEAFGGINYQIGHHIFPNISHVHAPKVDEIIKQTCEEFDVPYVSHPTLSSALWSFVRSIREISNTVE